MSFSLSIDNELAAILDLMDVDPPAGLAELRRLAEAENRSAILCLGLSLSEDGLTYDEAIPWLLWAVAFDSAQAAWNLAMIARQRKDSAQDRGYDVASVLRSG